MIEFGTKISMSREAMMLNVLREEVRKRLNIAATEIIEAEIKSAIFCMETKMHAAVDKIIAEVAITASEKFDSNRTEISFVLPTEKADKGVA